MKKRIIKPEFFTDIKTGKLSSNTQILFIGLWCLSDRNGVIDYISEEVNALLFPYKKMNIVDSIEELSKAGLIYQYSCYDKNYIQIKNFCKHQAIHPNEAKSELPQCDSLDVIKCNDITLNVSMTKCICKGKCICKSESKGRGFMKPTLEELKSYCLERKNAVDPESFLDHYIANGWLVGKNPMKDWKASVRTWERSGFNKPEDTKTKDPPGYDPTRSLAEQFREKQKQEKQNDTH